MAATLAAPAPWPTAPASASACGSPPAWRPPRSRASRACPRPSSTPSSPGPPSPASSGLPRPRPPRPRGAPRPARAAGLRRARGRDRGRRHARDLVVPDRAPRRPRPGARAGRGRRPPGRARRHRPAAAARPGRRRRAPARRRPTRARGASPATAGTPATCWPARRPPAPPPRGRPSPPRSSRVAHRAGCATAVGRCLGPVPLPILVAPGPTGGPTGRTETRSSLVGGPVEPGHDTGWGPGVTPAGLSPRWPMVA